MKIPKLSNLTGKKNYRIIPSVYPPINFFEDLVNADEMEILWEVESLTNDRLRLEAGDLFLVEPQDRVSGPGSSVVMAAFTHAGSPSRFTDGSYGVYYASLKQKTAIHETVYHRQNFLAATAEDPCELVMRMYESTIKRPLHDIRDDAYQAFHHSSNYVVSQEFAKQLRKEQSWGIIYNSVRDTDGICLAAFKPKTISVPHPVCHLKYVWDGKTITDILKVESYAQVS